MLAIKYYDNFEEITQLPKTIAALSQLKIRNEVLFVFSLSTATVGFPGNKNNPVRNVMSST